MYCIASVVSDIWDLSWWYIDLSESAVNLGLSCLTVLFEKLYCKVSVDIWDFEICRGCWHIDLSVIAVYLGLSYMTFYLRNLIWNVEMYCIVSDASIIWDLTFEVEVIDI